MDTTFLDSTINSDSPIIRAVEYYLQQGFDIIPIASGKKGPPLYRDWPNRDPYRMWKNAPPDSNIGIRFGGMKKVACIECDNRKSRETSSNIKNFLGSIGQDLSKFPMVVSASGGSLHIYFQLIESLERSYLILNKDLGAGEIRLGPGAFCVAPPSEINGNFYKLCSGSFNHLPLLSLSQIPTSFPLYVREGRNATSVTPSPFELRGCAGVRVRPSAASTSPAGQDPDTP